MGKVKGTIRRRRGETPKAFSQRKRESMGGGGQPAPAPKPAPLAPPVTQEAQRSTVSNTGRATGDILDPVIADEDKNKQILG